MHDFLTNLRWGDWAFSQFMGLNWYWYLVLLALTLIIYRVYIQKVLLNKFIKTSLVGYAKFKLILKTSLLIFSLIFLGLAALAPQLAQPGKLVQQQGRDILIALDVSRSMLVRDLTPNRLALAKTKIKKLVNLLAADRVGLILFSNTAFAQCPLTKDRAALNMFLDDVDVETISAGGTALDSAISTALQMSANSATADQATKLLVVFTDGEDFSVDLHAVEQQALAQHLDIFTVGVASLDGGPIPTYDLQGQQIGHQLDQSGKVVISKLNESVLADLAQACHGLYTRVSEQNDSDLQKIKLAIEKYERQSFGTKQEQRVELYPYLAGASLFCLLLEWLI